MYIAKESAQGSVILFVGNLVATGFSAIGSIFIARFLGPANYGLYSLAIVSPTLLQYFTHFGTRTAVPRFVAYNISIGDKEKANSYARASIVFSLLAGSIFTIISYYMSGFAASLLQRPSLQPFIQLASFIILGQSLLLTSVAASTGWNSMGRASLSNIAQSVIRAIASPMLILLGFGLGGAIIGHAASFLLAGIISVSLLYFRIAHVTGPITKLFSDIKELIRFGFSPFLANLLTGFSVFYISVLLSITANNQTVGYYQAATSLIIPATLLATATATALYPAFARLHGINGDLGTAFRMSVKYVGYLILPILFYLATCSKDLIRIIYGTSFSDGSVYLVLLSLSYVPLLLGQSVLPYFFNGVGRPRFTLYTTGASMMTLFILAPLLTLVGKLGVPGLVYSILISNTIIVVTGLSLIKRHKLGSVDYKSAIAISVSAALGLLLCSILPFLGSDLVDLLTKLVVFSVIYLSIAPLLGAIDANDADRILDSITMLPVVGFIVRPLILYEKRLATLRMTKAK